MTNQMQGEILFKGWDAANSQWVYTPWMPVRGDVGTFGVQVLVRNGVTLTWNVETRKADDPDDVDALFPSNQTIAAVDTSIATSDPGELLARQWVRYRFATGSGASTDDYVIFRALQPSWQMDR